MVLLKKDVEKVGQQSNSLNGKNRRFAHLVEIWKNLNYHLLSFIIQRCRYIENKSRCPAIPSKLAKKYIERLQ